MTIFKKIKDTGDWQALLDRVPFKTFFHTPVWEDFLEKEFSWMKFERYMWKDELLLSVARCRLFGKEKVVSHPLCEYGGPLPMKKEVDFESFGKDFHQEFGPGARIKFHPYIFKKASNPPKNNPGLSLSTFWIEDFSKKAVEDLWRGFRKTVRQEIKAGEGQGIYVEDCKSEEELKQFYNLYLGTVKRHKNIPWPLSVFRFLYEGTADAGILLAKKDGKVLGGSVFLFYKPFIHYFLSASDYQFRKWNIGHLILWSAMQEYKGNREYDYFDLGGTRRGSSLEVFKRGWGAKEYPICETGAGRIGSSNSFLRNVLGLIPPSVMRRLAPVLLWTKI